MDNDIDSKIDAYWGNLDFDIKNLNVDSYMKHLKEKYGEILDDYEAMYPEGIFLTQKEEKEVYDYEYITGLYKDYDPIQEYYRREVLKILVKNLQNKTIIDLGCGDGRISVGLTLFGNNIVYGNDLNEYAIELAEKKKSEHPEISDKVTFMKGDYTTLEFYRQIAEYTPDGVDTALFVRPVKSFFTARKRVYELLKSDGSMIVAMLHRVANQNKKDEEDRIEMEYGDKAEPNGFTYNIIKYVQINHDRGILVGEMKR